MNIRPLEYNIVAGFIVTILLRRLRYQLPNINDMSAP